MPLLHRPGTARRRRTEPPAAATSEPAVLLVVGAPRSGTSLLYRALCLHPGAAWISGWQRRLPSIPLASRFNRVVRRHPHLAVRAWFPDGNAYVYGRHRPLTERLVPAPVEGEPVLRSAGVPDPAATSTPDPRDAAATRRHLAAVARHSGGAVLVCKRIANNRRLAWWAGAVPDVRVVDVTRDGRAVSASLRRVDWWPTEELWWAGTDVAGWEQAGGEPIEACARHWLAELDAIEAGLGALSPEQVLRIRYEDLVADPIEVLHRIAAFGGLGRSTLWDESLATLRFPDRNDGWRAQLDAAEIERIESVAAAGLHRHGYAVGAP